MHTAIPHISPKLPRKTVIATDAQIETLREMGKRRFQATITGSGRLIVKDFMRGLCAIERNGSVTPEDNAWEWGWGWKGAPR